MENLNEKYKQTIEAQRTHLVELQDVFNAKCEEVKKASRAEIEKFAEEDVEGRKAVLQKEKAALEEALGELKTSVNVSTRDTMKKLEVIQTQREEKVLADLEAQINALNIE